MGMAGIFDKEFMKDSARWCQERRKTDMSGTVNRLGKGPEPLSFQVEESI